MDRGIPNRLKDCSINFGNSLPRLKIIPTSDGFIFSSTINRLTFLAIASVNFREPGSSIMLIGISAAFSCISSFSSNMFSLIVAMGEPTQLLNYGGTILKPSKRFMERSEYSKTFFLFSSYR